MEEKPLEDMTPDEIESVMLGGIAEGSLEYAGMEDGEVSFALTESGEAHAQELFGGKDVLEVAQKLNSIFSTKGVMGFTLPEGHDFIIFTLIATLCHAFKYYENWESLKEKTK